MNMALYPLCALLLVVSTLLGCSSKDISKFPVSDADYRLTDIEVGCRSSYSDDRKEDTYNSKYKDHWFTWEGEIIASEADSASINLDGVGTQDLEVEFEDKNAGYDLKKGQIVKVRFVMIYQGGCIMPFGGEHGEIISRSEPSI